MTKAKKLLISVGLLIPLFFAIDQAAQHSKKVVIGNLNTCEELSPNTRGYVKGIVTDVRRDTWNAKNYYSTISNNQCEFTILHRDHFMLRKPGTRVKALVEVESGGSGNLLFDKVTEDLTVVDTTGNVPEVKTVKHTVPKDITDKMRGKKYFTIHTSEASYEFPEHVISKVKPDIEQTWYYQEGEFSNPVVVDVE
ncbi:MAG: hypothetical protein RLZZ507_3596 [Cyanobacteriota bacterium]|jgi:hypothetical protein